ncbi:MAG: FapA family protein [Bacillota bacterium]|nr:FapA family protein [Bacillota bacterium]
MEEEVIYSDEYIKITKVNEEYFIESFSKGMSMETFNQIIAKCSQIQLTSFLAVKNAVLYAPTKKAKFGEGKERVFIEISNDGLKAFFILNVSDSEVNNGKNIELIKEIMKKLGEKGVVYGIKQDILLDKLPNHTKVLIAEGIPPVNGEDSVIKMYELKEPKPDIKDDGKVNHYELNLIDRVSAGDWLGERKDPTSGIPGKSVRGTLILAMPGKRYPLFYDKNSVKEQYENGVTTLIALRSGAVNYIGDKISVSNHLEIPENVDFKTGNIDFDGFLTVKGSIEDNFTVSAEKDIEVLGVYGVGSIKEIVSREGSVYIKGGVAGKNKAVIRSKRDIYTKFVSDAVIICEGRVHIGFYCLNSTIIAKEVILDSPKGQIIGGNIQADIKVVATVIGASSEIRTHITINGFNRTALKDNFESLSKKIEELKNEMIKAKQEMSIYPTSSLDSAQMIAYEKIKENYFDVKNQLKYFEDEKRTYANYLRTKGEGEVTILKKAFPNTVIEIKKNVREINQVILNTTFYYQNDDINEL